MQLASIAGRRESCQRLVAVQLFGLETLSCMSTTVMVTCSGRNLLISPSTPCLLPAWGQEAGPQCPNVPLPAPEATDALPEKVSHPPCTDMFILPWHVYLYPVSLLSLLNICVFSADTGLSLKFLTLQPQQMRRMRMEISPCMSVLDLHQ